MPENISSESEIEEVEEDAIRTEISVPIRSKTNLHNVPNYVEQVYEKAAETINEFLTRCPNEYTMEKAAKIRDTN